MGIWDNLQKRFRGTGDRPVAGLGVPREPEFAPQAATTLPTPPTPKVSNRPVTIPSYVKSAKPNTKSAYAFQDPRLTNIDITSLRSGANTRQIVRDFMRASPELSAAVAAYVRTGISSGYTAIARNPDSTVNPEATQALAQLITRMDVLNDYSVGFDNSPSLRELSETLAIELLNTGAMAGELVLDKARMPYRIQPIAVSQIKFYPSSDGQRLVPKQELAGEKIDLDIPTFIMVTLDQSTTDAYSASPLESAIQPVIASADFVNDVRRIVKRAVHPRQVISIDEEKFRKTLPPEIANDQTKLDAYMDEVVSNIENMINDLAPEDALVLFDTLGIEIVDHGNTNLAEEYKTIDDIQASKIRAGAKVLPTALGQTDGANAASTETLLFLKYVEGTVWSKLNDFYSKHFTLGVRLLGYDVYVEFAYDGIDLKPKSELEAFYTMKQSRVLDLLSLGFLTDEEAAIKLTGRLPPAGFKPLSGTNFRPGASAQPAGDGYNGASNSGSAANQAMKPDTPTGAKSQNGGKRSAESEVLPFSATHRV